MGVECEKIKVVLGAAPGRSLLVRDIPHVNKEGWVGKKKHPKGQVIITANI